MIPVEGSLQWAMNRGKLFRVDGGQFTYGQYVTHAETPAEACALAMYRDERYSTWLAPGTILTVWNVYDGTTGGYWMRDPVRFVFDRGQITKESN